MCYKTQSCELITEFKRKKRKSRSEGETVLFPGSYLWIFDTADGYLLNFRINEHPEDNEW